MKVLNLPGRLHRSAQIVENIIKEPEVIFAFPIRQTLSAELSWSHYLLLMQVENETERRFYFDETAKSGWSVRQLQRQINTMFYQRILASRDKESVAAEIQTSKGFVN